MAADFFWGGGLHHAACSPTRDQTWVPGNGNADSLPLDCQGIPKITNDSIPKHHIVGKRRESLAENQRDQGNFLKNHFKEHKPILQFISPLIPLMSLLPKLKQNIFGKHLLNGR